MAVRLRLTRIGRKKRPYYRVIAVDSRKKRDGSFIERIGYYHPLDNPPIVEIDGDKALKWLRNGAQPSSTVLSLLRQEGVWYRFRLEKRNLPEDQIQQMMNEWFEKNSKKLEAKKAALKKEETSAVEETPTEAAETAPAEAKETVEAAETAPTEKEKEPAAVESVAPKPEAETTEEKTEEVKTETLQEQAPTEPAKEEETEKVEEAPKEEKSESSEPAKETERDDEKKES